MASTAAPRYRQVADALQRRIASGDLGSHDRLASERMIADRFGLSRMTAYSERSASSSRDSSGHTGRGTQNVSRSSGSPSP